MNVPQTRGLRIYVASSWRNQEHQNVVAALRNLGHDVYDFKNPPGKTGFSWSQTTVGKPSRPRDLKATLDDPVAVAGFREDMRHLRACDVCVFVAPAGLSASLELGWAAGAGKATIVYVPDDAYDNDGLDDRMRSFEPELMWKVASRIITRFEDLVEALRFAA